MNPREVLDRMARAYKTARTYADHGTVVVVQGASADEPFPGAVVIARSGAPPPATRREQRATFATWFERPEQFRMDYRDERPDARDPRPVSEWTIWRTRGLTRRTSFGKTQLESSLTLAIGRVAGSSHGIAELVPCMLLPDEFRLASPLARLADAAYEGEEPRRAARCHRIAGRGPDDARLTVWVDAQTYLVREVRERRGSPDPERITTIDPAKDAPIERATFQPVKIG